MSRTNHHQQAYIESVSADRRTDSTITRRGRLLRTVTVAGGALALGGALYGATHHDTAPTQPARSDKVSATVVIGEYGQRNGTLAGAAQNIAVDLEDNKVDYREYQAELEAANGGSDAVKPGQEFTIAIDRTEAVDALEKAQQAHPDPYHKVGEVYISELPAQQQPDD